MKKKGESWKTHERKYDIIDDIRDDIISDVTTCIFVMGWRTVKNVNEKKKQKNTVIVSVDETRVQEWRKHRFTHTHKLTKARERE